MKRHQTLNWAITGEKAVRELRDKIIIEKCISFSDFDKIEECLRITWEEALEQFDRYYPKLNNIGHPMIVLTNANQLKVIRLTKEIAEYLSPQTICNLTSTEPKYSIEY